MSFLKWWKEMKTITLNNGIVLHLDPVRNVRTIGLCIVVNIGSIYEPKDKRGISHFFEHMLFKSNEKYSCKQIAESVELSGGCMNAITSTMTTSYIFEVIPRSFKRILDIAFHMFKNTRFVESEFESEKKVVLSEIEQSLNDPEARLWDVSMQAVYGASDYGDPIQGFRETAESIEKSELEEFKARFYTQDNMHIILSGNFTKTHVEDVKKVFCKLEGTCAKKKGTLRFARYRGVRKLCMRRHVISSLSNFSRKIRDWLRAVLWVQCSLSK